ncbi:MAG TPA: hypothetical protein PLR76_11400 [Hyphomonas sp.]|nr:hypothetical protein [Hyphomonas sp.]
MLGRADEQIDPDIFQIGTMILAAMADIVQLKAAAEKWRGKPSVTRSDDPAWEQVERLRRCYEDVFWALDELLSAYSRYADTLESADPSVRCGFGTFLVNMDLADFRRYSEARKDLMQGVTSIGIFSGGILQIMSRGGKLSDGFSKAHFLNYRDLNELLRSDCGYDEFVLRLRDLKDSVRTFFEGVSRYQRN